MRQNKSLSKSSSTTGSGSEDGATIELCSEIKHIRLPPAVLQFEQSEGSCPSSAHFLRNEVLVTLHGILFYFSQLLHLYRAVWWLPQSFQKRGVHLHLLPLPLTLFIVTVFTHRLRLGVTSRVFGRVISNFLTTLTTLLACFYSFSRLWVEPIGWAQLLYLIGPVPLLLALLDVDLTSIIFDVGVGKNTRNRNNDMEGDSVSCSSGTNSSKPVHLELERHLHVCTGSYGSVLGECEMLRDALNRRIGRVLGGAVMLSYYGSFLPWGMGKAHLHYSLATVSTHLLLSFLFSLTLIASTYLGPSVQDVVHRAVVHLPSDHVPPSLLRLHALFATSSFSRLLLGFHLSVQFLTFLVLIFKATEWYAVLSLVLLLVLSMNTLVRLGRDFLVVWRLYEAENVVWGMGKQN